MIVEIRKFESAKGGAWVGVDLANAGVDVYQGDQCDVTIEPESEEHLDHEDHFRIVVTSEDQGLLREVADRAQAAGLIVEVTA